MAKPKKKKTGSSVKTAAGVGAGLALAAAAAAGAYFLYGTKEGAKRRKKIKGWALKAKGEVLERMEGLKEVNERTYRQVVDAVAARYGNLKNVDKTELEALVRDLKRHWRNIQKDLRGKRRKAPKRSGARTKSKRANSQRRGKRKKS